jgi:hypothetical protein
LKNASPVPHIRPCAFIFLRFRFRFYGIMQCDRRNVCVLVYPGTFSAGPRTENSCLREVKKLSEVCKECTKHYRVRTPSNSVLVANVAPWAETEPPITSQANYDAVFGLHRVTIRWKRPWSTNTFPTRLNDSSNVPQVLLTRRRTDTLATC